MLFDLAAVVAIDVFLKSFMIVSTCRWCHVASETGFKQDSLNPNLDSDLLIECTFYWSRFRFPIYPNPDSLIEYLISER